MISLRHKIFLAGFSLIISSGIKAQVVLNEICPSNSSLIANDDGDYDDWIELYNAGSSAFNLQGYGLSDELTDPFKFTFPNYSLNAGARVLVFASDRNQDRISDHWETPINSTDTWRYFVGTSNPDTNWRNNSFNDNTWQQGTGGIGFGDGDDNTTITTCNSVMVRKHFTVADTSILLKAILNIDYDDGFVAYLNGTEIARANLGSPGDRPINTVVAATTHEAVMYQGMDPDSFYIDPELLRSIIRIGDNVLAVQVHNTSAANPDLSCIVFLTFGVGTAIQTWGNPPAWFGANGPEHFQAKFKLSKVGETVYLTHPSSTISDQRTYTTVELDNSTGRTPDGGVNWCTFNTPTPELTNNTSTCYSGYATIPLFSIPAGFYSGSQWLTLNTTQPGGTIRFTIDGSDVVDISAAYSAPILISSTKTIKAKVFAAGFLPSPVVVNTYFINESVHYPVFTITTDPENLWNYFTGIYVFGPNADSINSPFWGSNFWEDWEKPATIEYYDKNKNRVLRFNADIKINGGYSRGKPQKSFEVKLSDKYDTGELNYSFYSRKPYINEIDNFVLRNAGSDNNRLHFRDHLMQQNLQGTHSDFLAEDEVILYLNGQFWGIYQINENDDFHFPKNNYGYKKDEVDFLFEGGNIEVRNGSDTGFVNMMNYVTATPPNDPAFYSTMNSMFDLENLADYFIAETYYCNTDWMGDWTNNIKLWRPREAGGRWKYITYDLDMGLFLESFPDDNMLGVAINPVSQNNNSDLFDALLDNNQFRRYFINRYADLMNTIFLPSNMQPQLEQIRDSMALDISRQYSRWGLTSTMWNTEHNKAENFIDDRPAFARGYVQSEFAMTSQVLLTLNASPAGAGRIQISTITPASLPWSGIYYNGNPVTITAIPNPGYTFDHWHSNVVISTNDYNQSTTYNFTSNDQITAFFTGSATTAKITFSEINYHSDSINDPGDWVELYNFGTTSLDISGWKFKDEEDNHVFEFPVNTVIPADGYLVLAEDLAKFNQVFPAVTNVMGSLGFNFANSEEQLRLYNYAGVLYKSVYYSDQLPWPEQADGDGYTCELLDSLGDLNDGNNWFAGCLYGSPGRRYSAPTASATASGSTTFCEGGSVTLNAFSVAGYVYQWQYNHVNIPGATQDSYVASDSGTYTVAVTYQGCTMISDSVVVTVIQFSADPAGTAGYNCGPGQVTISATGSSISWYNLPNGNLLGTGNAFTTPVISTTTTYYVQAGSLCPSAFVPVVAEILQPAADPVANDVSRCGPGTVLLTAVDTAVMRWYSVPTGGTVLMTGPNFTTPFISVTTTYYVEAGSVCPSARIPVQAIINSANAPTVTDGERCGPGSVVLMAASPDPVSWYAVPTGGAALFNGYTFNTPSISVTTTYYAEANNGCASARVPVVATINPVSDPPVVTSSYSCGTGNVTLLASSSDPVNWYDAPTGGALLGSGPTLTFLNLSVTTIAYAVAGVQCPSIPVPDTAFIYPVPTVNLGNDTVIISPQTVTLDPGAGFVNYLWSTSATTQTISVGITDFYWVVVTDVNGCTAADTIQVTVDVGIYENEISSVVIYPNPAHEVLYISVPASVLSESMQWRLCDVTGRTILTQPVVTSNTEQVSLKNISKGVYLLIVESENDRVLKTLIIN